jgi:hypothetical protein
MFTTSQQPRQFTATAHHLESTGDGAQTEPVCAGPTRHELIQWVSLYWDEVDPLAVRDRRARPGGRSAAASPALR